MVTLTVFTETGDGSVRLHGPIELPGVPDVGERIRLNPGEGWRTVVRREWVPGLAYLTVSRPLPAAPQGSGT